MDPSVSRIDENENLASPQRRRSLPYATGSGEATYSRQSEFWHLPTRTATFPGISRTLAYAMGQVDGAQAVGPPGLATPREARPEPQEEKGVERNAGTLKASLPSEVAPRSRTGGDRVDISELAWRHTDGEAGQEAVLTHQDRPLSQSHQEDRHIELKKQEMEVRRAKAEVQILEETLQAREKDLCNRLETVRQRLVAIHQRKALIDHQEDALRQKLLEASMERTPAFAERSYQKLAGMQELQGGGAEAEAEIDPPLEL
ncbi:hypothetical protein F5148DRAFT_1206685 [Russula earlei]|uniref:Uncharacterized protein n=1 Tax=Russula earlei TaxID=71964 RepID=A0ACC0U6G4_9AGAM|nr:hypothetical protein F5148DRAFT_1206685 [Russula earlei]